MSDFIATENAINNIEKKVNQISDLVDSYREESLNIVGELEELEFTDEDFEDIIEASIDDLDVHSDYKEHLSDFDESDFGIKLKVNRIENRENLILALVDSGYKVSNRYDHKDTFVFIEEGNERFY